MFDYIKAINAGYSDQEIAEHLSSQGKFDLDGSLNAGYSHGEIARHLSGIKEDDWQKEIKNQKVRAFNTEHMGDVSRGWNKGVQQTQGMLYGAAGLTGSMVGSDKLKDWGVEGYKRNMDEASLYPTKTLDDVKGVGSFIDYAQGLAGEFAPTMVEAALGSLMGGGVGYLGVRQAVKQGAKKYAKELVEDQIQKGIVSAAEKEIAQKTLEKQFIKKAINRDVYSKVKTRAAKAGMLSAVTALESGGNYGEVLEEHGIDNPYSALGFGSLAASFELAGGNIKLIDNFLGTAARKVSSKTASEAEQHALTKLLKRTGREILKNVPAEALQEAGQEVTSILNTVVNTDEKLLTPDNVKRVFESGFAGGMMGSGGGLVRGLTSKEDLSVVGGKDDKASPADALSNDPAVSEQGDKANDSFLDNFLEGVDQPEAQYADVNPFDKEVIKDGQIRQFEEDLAQAQSEIQDYSTEPVTPKVTPDAVEIMERQARVEQQAELDKIDETLKQDDPFLNPNKGAKQAGTEAQPENATPTTQETPKLDAGQQAFVDKKVQELGTIEAVEKFYPGKDKVSEYARAKARELFQAPEKVAPVEVVETEEEVGQEKFDPVKLLQQSGEENQERGLAPKDYRDYEKSDKVDTLKIIDLATKSLNKEIQDWQTREYKENKKTVSAGGTKDDFNSNLTSIGQANENRRRRVIEDKEQTIASLQGAKKRIDSGEDIKTVLEGLLDSRYSAVSDFAKNQLKGIEGDKPSYLQTFPEFDGSFEEHERVVRDAIDNGDISLSRAKELGHFKFHPNLKNNTPSASESSAPKPQSVSNETPVNQGLETDSETINTSSEESVFTPGQSVTWQTKSGTQSGTLVKENKKTWTVQKENGKKAFVSKGKLEADVPSVQTVTQPSEQETEAVVDKDILHKIDTMQSEVNSTHTRGVTQKAATLGGETIGFSSNSPQWMRTLQEERKRDKQKALSRAELNALFNKLRSGKSFTKRQQEQYFYLERAIKSYAGEVGEFVSQEEADEMEKKGFDPVGGVKIPVAQLEQGDKFVGTVDGIKDEFEVKDTNEQGETLLQDGIAKRVDMFDEVVVDGIKKGDKAESGTAPKGFQFSKGDIEIVDNVEDNRVQILFNGKPSEEIRNKLKSNGFRWSPKNKAWQRQRSVQALWLAKDIAGIKDETRYSTSSDRRPFYSALEKGIQNFKQEKAPAMQWESMIRKLPVKKEELEWVGIKEWLREQKGKVKKQEILDFVRANNVEVQEVEKGDHDTWVVFDGEEEQYFSSKKEAVEYAIEMDIGTGPESIFPQDYKDPTEGATKFHDYQLPGGENYKEMLLTLPQKENIELPEGYSLQQMADGDYTLIGPDGTGSVLHVNNLADAEYEATRKLSIKDPVYQSSHFDEPNILAHVRFNERTDADGNRVLFIEEIQSDWHQEGRKRGYFSQKDQEEYQRRNSEAIDVLNEIGLDPTPYDLGWVFSEGNTYDTRSMRARKDRREALKRLLGEKWVEDTRQLMSKNLSSDIPDAPFKKSWPLLAFKRMVRYAAENGFDKVAWTTGEQQAERYDLSKQINHIDYRKTESGYHIAAVDNDMNTVIDKEGLTDSQLEDHIGKEITQKIINGEGDSRKGYGGFKRLQGAGLKAGGAGMRSFYDRMLPSMVNKFFKKYGVKVGGSAINEDVGWPFSIAKLKGDRGFVVRDKNKKIIETLMTRDEAEKWISDMADTVHSIDITPSLRKVVLGEGLPLFQSSDKNGKIPKEVKHGRSLAQKRNTPEHQKQSRKKVSREDAKRHFHSILGFRDKSGKTRLVTRFAKKHKQLQDIAKAFGKELHFFTSENREIKKINGVTNPSTGNEIFINAKSTDPLISIVGHELVHQLKYNHPDLYDFLANTIRVSDKNFQQYIDTLLGSRKGSFTSVSDQDVLYEEFIADFAADQFQQVEFWSKLVQKDRTLTERIIDILQSILDKIRTLFPRSEHLVSNLKESQDALAYAMGEALKRGNVQGIGETGTKSQTKLRNIDSKAFKDWFGDSKVVDENGEPLVVYHGTKEVFNEFKTDYSDGLFFFAFDPKFAERWARGRQKDTPRNYLWTDEMEAHAQDVARQFNEMYDNSGDKDAALKWYDENRPPSKYLLKDESDAAIMPVYLSIQKPFIPHKHFQDVAHLIHSSVHMEAQNGAWLPYENKKVISKLKSLGYDGIYLKEGNYSKETNDISQYSTIAAFDNKQIKSIYNKGTWDINNPDIRYSTSADAADIYTSDEKTKSVLQQAYETAQDYALAAFKPEKISGLDKKDLNIVQRVVAVLSHWKGTDKTADKIIDVILNKQSYKAEEETRLFTTTGGVKGEFDHFKDSLLKLYKTNKLGYKKLQKYIRDRDIGRIGWKIKERDDEFFAYDQKGKQIGRYETEAEAEQAAIRDEVDKYGGNDQERQALESYRNITVNGYHHMRQAWDEVIQEVRENDMPMPQTVIETAEGEIKVDIDVALKKMGDLRGMYFPRLRESGTYNVFVKKKGTNSVSQYFDSKFQARAFLNKKKREGYSGEIKPVGKLPESVYSNMTRRVADLSLVTKPLSNIPTYKRTLSHLGFKGTWKGKDYILSGQIEQGMDDFLEMMGGEYVEEIQNGAYRPKMLFKNAHKSIEKSVTDALFRYKGYAPTLNKQLAMDMVEAVSDEIKGHGNRSRMIRRSEAKGKDVVMGYEEDLLTATAQFVSGIAGSEAKRRIAHKGYGLLIGQEKGWEEFRDEHTNGQRIKEIEQTLEKLLINSPAEQREIKRNKAEASKLRGKLFRGEFSTAQEAKSLIKQIESLKDTSRYSDKTKANSLKKELRARKNEVWIDYMDLIKNSRIDAAKQPQLYDSINNAMEDVLRNNDALDRTIGRIRGVTVFYFLSGRVSSAAVNLTNLLFGVPGVMKREGISFHNGLKNIGKSIELYRKYKFARTKLPKDTLALFDAISEKGLDEPKLNREAFEMLQGKIGRGWTNMMHHLMLPFSVTEQVNRAATVAGSYISLVEKNKMEMTDKNGDVHVDILKQAKEISDDAHGIYDPANRPEWMKGDKPAARILSIPYIFNTFTHNYLLTMARMGWRGMKSVSKDPKTWNNKDIQGAMWMAFAPAILGVSSSIGTKAVINLIGKAMDSDDPEEDFYKYVEENFGGSAERFARYGAAGVMEHGVDFTGSLSMGLPDGGMGAFGSLVGDIWEGTQNLTKGFYWEAAEDFSPAFIKNPLEATRKLRKGTTTYSGAPVLYDGEKVQHDAIDTVLEFMSFRPTREAYKLDSLYKGRKLKAVYQEKRSEIYKRLKGYYSDPPQRRNPNEYAQISRMIKEYNKRVRDKGLTDAIPFITERSKKQSLKGLL